MFLAGAERQLAPVAIPVARAYADFRATVRMNFAIQI
jgi:hypothetical protein